MVYLSWFLWMVLICNHKQIQCSSLPTNSLKVSLVHRFSVLHDWTPLNLEFAPWATEGFFPGMTFFSRWWHFIPSTSTCIIPNISIHITYRCYAHLFDTYPFKTCGFNTYRSSAYMVTKMKGCVFSWPLGTNQALLIEPVYEQDPIQTCLAPTK